MALSGNQLHYFIGSTVAFVVFGLIAQWHLWPALKDRPQGTAHLAVVNLPVVVFVPALVFPYLLRYGSAVSELTIANTFKGKRLSV